MKIARFFVCRRAGRKLAFVRNRSIQKRGHLRKQDAVFALDCRMARGGTGKRSASDVIPAGECQRPNPRRAVTVLLVIPFAVLLTKYHCAFF